MMSQKKRIFATGKKSQVSQAALTGVPGVHSWLAGCCPVLLRHALCPPEV